MAIPFSKIKPTVLEPQDFIGIGKLAGKRVADAALSDPEYLLWAHKEKVLVLSSISLVLVNASNRRQEAVHNYNTDTGIIEFDDVPF